MKHRAAPTEGEKQRAASALDQPDYSAPPVRLPKRRPWFLAAMLVAFLLWLGFLVAMAARPW